MSRPGRSRLGRRRQPRRSVAAAQPLVDRFRVQHLALERQPIDAAVGAATVTIDQRESPLLWLARRRGRDGQPLVAPHQMQAGERLRRDFTIAGLMPHTASNWTNPLPAQSGGGAGQATDTMTDARRRVHGALGAVGADLAGLAVDVCCFLKGLEDIEHERQWPPRAARVVLQLALERLAQHYGYAAAARGPDRARLRAWSAAMGANE